jgi:hypothetical protein
MNALKRHSICPVEDSATGQSVISKLVQDANNLANSLLNDKESKSPDDIVDEVSRALNR